MSLKRLGFSMAEIRRMTMRDFLAYTDIAFGDADKIESTGTREPTQEDIDAFLS